MQGQGMPGHPAVPAHAARSGGKGRVTVHMYIYQTRQQRVLLSLMP